jgi:short-subunit dehydrogenase
MDASALKGKTVLVTGAARGLGAAFACVFAEAGCRVIMTGRLREALEGTAQSIQVRTGVKPETHLLDLAEVGNANSFGEQLAVSCPKLDILINNGAQWLEGRMDEYDAYAVNTTINSAATGSFLLTRKLVPSLVASGAGDIVNIVSTSGIENTPLHAASVPFYMAKHAQAAMSNGLRQEFKGKPVRVHAIYPPTLDNITPFDDEQWQAPGWEGGAVTTRDVVEAAIYALTRPRNVTAASIVLDAVEGGMWE